MMKTFLALLGATASTMAHADIGHPVRWSVEIRDTTADRGSDPKAGRRIGLVETTVGAEPRSVTVEEADASTSTFSVSMSGSDSAPVLNVSERGALIGETDVRLPFGLSDAPVVAGGYGSTGRDRSGKAYRILVVTAVPEAR